MCRHSLRRHARAGILAPKISTSRGPAWPGPLKASHRRPKSCPLTEKFGDLGNKSFKGQWREGSGPLALSPSQGHSQQAGLAPSFLYTPLCHHGKPQRSPVQSKSAPGRQGLLGVVNSRSEDNGPARGCRMPLALLSWTHRVKAGEQSLASSGSSCSEALHLAVPLQCSTLSCSESQSQDKWYCCLPSSLLERREEVGRERNDPREPCSRKPPVLSPPPYSTASLDSWTSQVQQGPGAPTASRSYLEVPSIQEEKHVPNPRRVWLLWFLSGKVAVKTGKNSCKQQM